MSSKSLSPGPLSVRPDSRSKIAIVGPCASGKSTLADSLARLGYRANQVVQEHSYVPDMWQKIAQPAYLIFLDCDYSATLQRKPLGWTEQEYDNQQTRLEHARDHCDLLIDTTSLSIDQVFDLTIAKLEFSEIDQ